MCWFIIDPKTGRYGRHVKKPGRRGKKLYLHNFALDSFFDIGYAFHDFLSPYSRPSFADLMAFVIDGETRQSLTHLPQVALAEHQNAMRVFWTGWDAGSEGYLAVLGRPMLREEKYWLVRGWVRRMAVDRKQYYKGNAIAREEWLVNWECWDGVSQRGPYGRLRVFANKAADAWTPGMGLLGHDSEEDARREFSEAGYRACGEIDPYLLEGDFPPPPLPGAFTPNDSTEPFRYEGTRLGHKARRPG